MVTLCLPASLPPYQIKEAVSFGVDKVLVPHQNKKDIEVPMPGEDRLTPLEVGKVVYVADVLDVFEHAIEGETYLMIKNLKYKAKGSKSGITSHDHHALLQCIRIHVTSSLRVCDEGGVQGPAAPAEPHPSH